MSDHLHRVRLRAFASPALLAGRTLQGITTYRAYDAMRPAENYPGSRSPHTLVRLCAHKHTLTHTHTHTHTHPHTHTHTHTHTQINTHTFWQRVFITPLSLYVYVHTYYTSLCIYIYISYYL